MKNQEGLVEFFKINPSEVFTVTTKQQTTRHREPLTGGGDTLSINLPAVL
jgi:hypothetical protein